MKKRTFDVSSSFAKLSFCALVAALVSGAVSTVRADYAGTVLSLNPIVYYRLNETAAPPAPDIASNSGTAGARGNAFYYNVNALDPTLNAQHAVPGALAGSSDTAALFDGNANYVMLALPDETNSLNPQGVFTAEVWLNPSGEGSGCPLSFADVNGLGGDADGWLISQTLTNWDLTMFAGEGSQTAVNISGGTVASENWYHLAAVYDGTNAYLYFNGQPVAQASAAGFVPNRSGQLTIGARSDVSTFFAGSVDEVAIYTNALSAADVLAHYQNGTNASRGTPYNLLVQTNNPLLYYRLDEPAYTAPDPTTFPMATNLSTLFGTNANGIYYPGTTPGAAGPPFAGLGPSPLACKFNGASGCVQLGDFVTLLGGSIPSTLTVSAWVKLDDLEQNRGFDYIVGADDDSFRLQRGITGDHGTLQWACNGEHISSYEGLTPLDDGQWHHLVAIVAPTGITNYVDGVLDYSRPEPTLQGSLLSTSGTLTSVGEVLKSPGRVWNGSISEVAIFASNLSPAQVQQLYNASEASPEITQQPALAPPVYEGSTVSLSVTAVGVQPLAYQWTVNGRPIGQPAPTLVFTNVTFAINGNYAVIVTNAYGMVTSSVVPITVVAEAPVIRQLSPPITRWVGGSPTLFSVVAGGSEPDSYQWQIGTNPIPGATSATLTLSGPLQASDSGAYEVVVTNPHGSVTSAPVALTVATPPNNYAAQVMAFGPYTYWTLDETNGSTAYDYSSGLDGTNIGGVILGAAGNPAPGFGGHPVYNFNSAGAVDCGNGINLNNTTFTVLAWINENSAGSEQAGIITKGVIAGVVTPNASFCLASTSFSADYLQYTANGIYPFMHGDGGGTATFYTGPGGSYSPPMTNALDDSQWHFIAAVYDCPYSSGDKRLYIDGVLVQEANVLGSSCKNPNDVLIGNIIDGNNNDHYWPGLISDVALFNRALSPAEIASLYAAATNSSPAALGIAGQPVSQVAFAGNPVTLTVGATGPQPFSYQWSKAGVAIPGATRQSYTIASVSPSDAGSYAVTVSDHTGSVNSQPAWLSVVPAGNPTGISVGLVAHYQFESNFADSSGNNHNGMAVGSPVFVPGQIGTAIHVDTTFSSLNDCVVLDNPTNIDNNADFQFNPGDMFSIAFWVNYTGTPGDLPMIANVVNSTDNQGLVLADSFYDDNGGNLQLSIEAWPGPYNFGEGDFIADGATPLNDGNWHHIAAAIDTLNNIARVYIDGALAVTHVIPNVGNLNYSDGYLLGSDPTYAYQGNTPGGYSLDDLGIWRRLLTASEVANIYAAGLSGQSFAAAVPSRGVVVPLTITETGTNVTLSWPQGNLESAPAVGGPWAAVLGASAPSFSTPRPAAPTFYRVRP
jgi:hypothetical protein